MAGMEDIAKRLRAWAAYELHESDPAAVILLAAEEIERLRLTDAEREAIELAWCSVGRDDAFHQRDEQRIRDTLLVLLERTK